MKISAGYAAVGGGLFSVKRHTSPRGDFRGFDKVRRACLTSERFLGEGDYLAGIGLSD